MASIIEKGYKAFILKPFSRLSFLTNKFSKAKQCYICKAEFANFTKHRGGSDYIPDFFKKLTIVGSDVDNFRCMYCKAHDRERHMFMYFDKLNFWSKFAGANVLHFAVEKNLSARIVALKPNLYVKADLYPKDSSITRMDVTSITHPDNTFDVIICNHVLEHVPDYSKALREFYRTLKPGGSAIIQAPYSKMLPANFEVKHADTDELRNFFYGQPDHVRVLSEDQYFRDIVNAGLKLNLVKNADYFSDADCVRYGVNKEEDMVIAVKP